MKHKLSSATALATAAIALGAKKGTEMTMKTLFPAACAVLTLFAAGSAASSNIYFSDGTFGSGWVYSLSGIRAGDSETDSATTPASGGNPGAFEMEKHTLTSVSGGPNAAGYWSNFNPIFSFTGSFASVSYSWDLNDFGQFAVGYSPAIQQGGTVFVHATGNAGAVFPPSGWANGQNPFTGNNLTANAFCAVTNPLGVIGATNFLDCNTHPTFSSPTQLSVFGYAVSNSFSANGGTVSYASGIDNWCVELKKPIGTAGKGRSKKCIVK